MNEKPQRKAVHGETYLGTDMAYFSIQRGYQKSWVPAQTLDVLAEF